jgi:hypothetical protein
MQRARKIAGLGTVAMIAACAPRASACTPDPITGLCCTSGLTLAPPVSQPLGAIARSGGGGGPEATTLVHVFSNDYSAAPVGPPVDPTINLGDTIHWQWDASFHSVTSVSGSVESFSSGVLNAGATLDHTFTHAGVFTYFCTIHGHDNGDGTTFGMSGTITVVVPVVSSTWNVDFDGSWQTASNWTNNAIPTSAGDIANFGSSISGPRGINVDAPTTVGAMNFDSPSPKSYLIAGGSTLSLSGASGGVATVGVADGSHTITTRLQPVTGVNFNVAPATSTLSVSSLQTSTSALTKQGNGTLIVNNVRAGGLNISSGTVVVSSNGGDTGASRVNTLTIVGGAAPTATLDLKNNDMIVTSGAVGVIQAQIKNARHGGAWDQFGITSSAAQAATPKNTTLGLLSGTEYKTVHGPAGTFDGFTIADSDLLIKYTYYGDTDFNGVVDFDDYSRTDSGFNNNKSGWFNGDFDYNGIVDFDDYSLIDLAFNTQSGTLRRAIDYLNGGDRSDDGMNLLALRQVEQHYAVFGDAYATSFLNAVPEPTSAGVLLSGLAASAASIRRRRRLA